MQWRAEEMGVHVPWPVVVQVDNKQAQSFQQGTCVHTKIRGTFDMREAWIKELKDQTQIKVEHVPGEQNCADLMSKPHRTPRFQQLLNSIAAKSAGRCSAELAMRAMMLWVP